MLIMGHRMLIVIFLAFAAAIIHVLHRKLHIVPILILALSVHTSNHEAYRDQVLITKLPNIRGVVALSKFIRGLGHNSYGEFAWPNDILYIFLVVILGIMSLLLVFSIIDPTNLVVLANPFATPYIILPTWYFFATFNLLRLLPDKLLGVLSLISIPLGLLITFINENTTKYQNPFRRPLFSTIYILGFLYSMILSIVL